MAGFCAACGNELSGGRFCPACGAPLARPGREEPRPPEATLAGPARDEASSPSSPPPGPEESGQPRRLRWPLPAAGATLVVLAVVLAIVLGGGSGEEGEDREAQPVSASHPSGLEVRGSVTGGASLEIDEVDTAGVEVPEYLKAESAWSITADGALTGDTLVTVPDPGLKDFVLLAWEGSEWVPAPFSTSGSGDLEVTLDAEQLAALALVPASSAVVAGAEDLAAYGILSELRLAVASIDVGGFVSELSSAAGRISGRLMGEIASAGGPAMCSNEFSGARAETDADGARLAQVCVEDRAGTPIVKLGNATRFALEFFEVSGVDLAHHEGGVDFGPIGARGVVAGGGETLEWEMAPGSTGEFAVEFTEYAFLHQVANWAIDLIPAGSEVLETGQDLAEAVGVLKDALGVAGGLESLAADLRAGEYRRAGAEVAGLLTQQRVIRELADRGFFERLGYRLGEDTIEEVFEVLQVGGYLADLADLLYTTWQTGGYVRGAVLVRLPGGADDLPATTRVTWTATTGSAPPTGVPTTVGDTTDTTGPGGAAGTESLGSFTAGETPAYLEYVLSEADAAAVGEGAARILISSFSADDPGSTFKYGGWGGDLSVNGAAVYFWEEFDGTDSLYWDAALGTTVYGATGVGEWNDVSHLMRAGSNEIYYDHNNEGPGIGIKVRIER